VSGRFVEHAGRTARQANGKIPRRPVTHDGPREKNPVRRLSVRKRGRQGSGTREVRGEPRPETSVSRPCASEPPETKSAGKLTEAFLDPVTSRPVRRLFHRSRCVGPKSARTCSVGRWLAGDGRGFWSRVALRPRMLGGVADVTQILDAIEQGDPKAAAELLPLVYDELRKLAGARAPQTRPRRGDRRTGPTAPRRSVPRPR
jgi:hypothetical protein